MDLIDALRSTAAIREFTDEPVPDEVLRRILDTARFAPSGANAQAWHVVIVKNPRTRTRLRELYQPGWRDYLAMCATGLRPWAPTNDRHAEAAAVAAVPEQVAAAAAEGLAALARRTPALRRRCRPTAVGPACHQQPRPSRVSPVPVQQNRS